MLIDLKSAEYCGGYKIKLIFDDGKSGVVDFASYIKKKGVFKKFKDISFFKHFIVDPEVKTLVWENEIDIAPETLYIQATHAQLPTWMQK